MKKWSRAVNAIMRQGFAVSLDDLGFDETDMARFFHSEPDPAQFVRWYAAKYDLDHISACGLGSDIRLGR